MLRRAATQYAGGSASSVPEQPHRCRQLHLSTGLPVCPSHTCRARCRHLWAAHCSTEPPSMPWRDRREFEFVDVFSRSRLQCCESRGRHLLRRTKARALCGAAVASHALARLAKRRIAQFPSSRSNIGVSVWRRPVCGQPCQIRPWVACIVKIQLVTCEPGLNFPGMPQTRRNVSLRCPSRRFAVSRPIRPR